MAKRVFKSRKKLSGGPSSFRKWDEWEEGDVLIGKLVGQREDNYGNPSWQVEVEEAQFMKKKEGAALAGKTITLNSAGQLNKALEQVEEGQFIQVTYNGKSRIEKGIYKGKDAHLIGVELLEEDDGSDDSEEIDEEEEYEDDGSDL